MTIILNKDNFEESIKSGITLVDFWAEWCSPCQVMLPILDEVSKEVDGIAKVGKVNVDNSPEIASNYRIMSIPTLIIFKDGEPIETMVGTQKKNDLISKLKGI